MGLRGAGKTTLAKVLAPRMSAVLFNADEVRANLSKDLGFTIEDRIEHARRIGWLCDRVADAGMIAIADFICPTPETRRAFGPAFIVWVDRSVRRGPEESRPRVDAEVDPALCRAARGADAGGGQGGLPRSVAHGVEIGPFELGTIDNLRKSLRVHLRNYIR